MDAAEAELAAAAPKLYAMLFPRVVRSAGKKKDAEEQSQQQQPVAEQKSQQKAAATETSNAA